MTNSKSQLTTRSYYLVRYVAMITMLIDHIGSEFSDYFSQKTYIQLRMIGRMSFPLFCYLLVECFYFTKDKKRHFQKLLKLAVISEIPFNIHISGKIIDIEHQSVICSLIFGFLYLWISDMTDEKFRKFPTTTVRFTAALTFMYMAQVFSTDYLWKGILMIVMLDFAKRHRFTGLFQTGAFLVFVLLRGWFVNLGCVFSLIMILAVSKNKDFHEKDFLENVMTSKLSKIFCTVFYPAHLLLLAIVHRLILA